MGLMKIFSGEEKLALELHKKIEEIGVAATLKNNSQINKSAKSTPVEIFVQETDFNKVHQVIEDFRMSL